MSATIDQSFYIMPSEARANSRRMFVQHVRSFEDYMRDVFRVIRQASEAGHTECSYQVPIMLPGTPALPLYDVLRYMVNQLRAVRYWVDIGAPGNVLFIRWYHDDVFRFESVGKPTTSAPELAAAATAAPPKAAAASGRKRRTIPAQ